jgi:amidase
VNRHRVRREDHQYSFDPTSEPIPRVEPGAAVVVETFGCFTNKITSSEQVFAKEADLLALVGEYNPISRPIHIEGAQPGDTLAVRIDDIALGAFAPYAVTMLTGDFASICGRPVVTDGIGPDTRICPLESDHIVFPTLGGDLRLPTRPMIGTIGTAPADRSWISLHSALGHGGNMDCPSLTMGSTVLLPVNVAGGLLSLASP